ncbi:MAG: site-specific DNA-methyltransferase [Solidesulfovibrio sp.]|uniref:site-specific DNA-methyltransferase n=1 Tax=Desulfovibrionaceae TaxID=194924 RepID=UPI001FACB828|nr:site-specific DNA-methyltransferase [Fundidesulfovibrio agrisoli]
MASNKILKTVETITHEDASRKHIPTAECQSILRKEHQNPIRVAYERRNRDLDPQLVWRGKDEQDWSDLVVHAPPLFIQEKVHPKVLIDDLTERTRKQEGAKVPQQMSLFDDFNGLPNEDAKTEFYQHDANWSNRMILGDSLQVMASLAEREGLRGKVQCIYFDPPYGIKFNSNFQWSTTTRTVSDGKKEHITREPEQVKAFRDTWRDGVHSYLSYLRDRLTVARDLLKDSGSIFVQIGDDNVHRARTLMDEVFGEKNFISMITLTKAASQSSSLLANVNDYILWYGRNKESTKYRQLFQERPPIENPTHRYICVEDSEGTIHDLSLKQKMGEEPLPEGVFLRMVTLTSQTGSESSRFPYLFSGKQYRPPGARGWSTGEDGLSRVEKSGRMWAVGSTLMWKNYHSDYPYKPRVSLWDDIRSSGFGSEKLYVVQTQPEVIQRCILMASDPGDLVIDPTCGSGTTAFIAEQWGRRWITIDTSRVALALARARIMGARYPYYLLSDSKDGKAKQAQLSQKDVSQAVTHLKVSHGFVNKQIPHVTLRSIANNAEIDVIYEEYRNEIGSLLNEINLLLGESWNERQMPQKADSEWPAKVRQLHETWRKLFVERQNRMEKSISVNAISEQLYDVPYEDNKKVRVAGPFTVESLSPHRVLTVDENDELVDELAKPDQQTEAQDFAQMILENLKTAGVQQAHKEDKIVFSTLKPWPGHYVCAEGVYYEGEDDSGIEKRAAIFIGPEFGTVSRPDLVAAAREAGDAGFDALIACAFNYDAHSSEFNSLGRIPVLKARMNADLHMADDLKNTGKGNLFVIFGEPDIDILEAKNNQVQVKINGVDVFHPNTGEVRSDGAEGIACWFIDTDYNEESFFVRHAYFLGANDPYQALKTTLKAEINQECWDSLNSDISRPFDKPKSGRIAVKVINHLGDEVMKVYRVE